MRIMDVRRDWWLGDADVNGLEASNGKLMNVSTVPIWNVENKVE